MPILWSWEVFVTVGPFLAFVLSGCWFQPNIYCAYTRAIDHFWKQNQYYLKENLFCDRQHFSAFIKEPSIAFMFCLPCVCSVVRRATMPTNALKAISPSWVDNNRPPWGPCGVTPLLHRLNWKTLTATCEFIQTRAEGKINILLFVVGTWKKKRSWKKKTRSQSVWLWSNDLCVSLGGFVLYSTLNI